MDCENKTKYTSEKAAKKGRRAVGKARQVKLRVYKCDKCYQYHLTSQIRLREPLL